MQTHPAKRVEIIIEAVMEKALVRALREAGITGYTVLPVMGGSGRSGEWSREGQVGRASGMVAIISLVAPERVELLLEKAFAVVDRHIGLVNITDAEVVRIERF